MYNCTFFSAGFRSGVLAGACGKLGSLDRGGGRGSSGRPEQSSVKDNEDIVPNSLGTRPLKSLGSGSETSSQSGLACGLGTRLYKASSLVPRLSRNANIYRAESLVSFVRKHDVSKIGPNRKATFCAFFNQLCFNARCVCYSTPDS